MVGISCLEQAVWEWRKQGKGEKERVVCYKGGVLKDGRGLEMLYAGGKDEGEAGG